MASGATGARAADSGQERASLTSIAYHLGALRPIADIDFLKDDSGRLELYRLAGFDCYAESDLSMRVLALRSAVETLAESGIDPGEIGVCLYVAESFDRDEAADSAEVNRLLIDLGMDKAVPINISISNCANILAAVRIASSLIQAGETQHVLIVSVDKASRRYGGRRMFREMSLKSDGSVSCLVSRPGVGAWGILYLGQHNAAALIQAETGNASSYAVSKFQGIRHAANQARAALALGSADFARIITNNYGREVSKMLVELCGFYKDAGWFDNIGRFAHAVAGDVLINLTDLEAGGAVKSGDRIFMMADSITASAVMCLERR